MITSSTPTSNHSITRRAAAVLAAMMAALGMLAMSSAPANAVTIHDAYGTRGFVSYAPAIGLAGHYSALSFGNTTVTRAPNYSGTQVIEVKLRIWELSASGGQWRLVDHPLWTKSVAAGQNLTTAPYLTYVSPDLYHVDYQVWWETPSHTTIGYADYDLNTLNTDYGTGRLDNSPFGSALLGYATDGRAYVWLRF